LARRRARLLVLPLAALVALGGCGGDDAGAEDWANGVCGDVGAWVGDVDETLQSLTDDGLALDEADLVEAADAVGEATDELAANLRELGAPEVESGQRARAELETLLERLRDQYERAREALSADLAPLETVARLATALSAAAAQLQETFDDLRALDPGGELAEAFRNAEDCDALQDQLANIGSR
jgi:chromosome segregation ATPase